MLVLVLVINIYITKINELLIKISNNNKVYKRFIVINKYIYKMYFTNTYIYANLIVIINIYLIINSKIVVK